MAGRATELTSPHVTDVREVAAELLDEESDEMYAWPALEITLRLSKTNRHGRTRDVVRILAQNDDTSPVTLHRMWAARLAAAEITAGPLLRRVKNGTFTTVGRPPANPTRAEG
ncbi:hypothetical protein ACFT38_27865 [Streptomyces sp. NPDC056975]|uniref:hypothetical protein n=1 Tax=Streptomyces sp. NPDC056975 TaxID=3345985 RepID=UPI00362DC725